MKKLIIVFLFVLPVFAFGQTVTEQANGLDLVLAEVSSATTATMRAVLPVNATSAAITITPPASPQPGDWFAVSDSRSIAATNNITIDFSGASQKLHGTVQNYVMNAAGDFQRFIYIDSTVGFVSSK